MNPYWSTGSLIFYLFLAFVGMVCMGAYKNHRVLQKHSCFYLDLYSLIWISIWTFFAVFRVVKPGLGGSDAIDYVYYFEHCNQTFADITMLHIESDLFYKWINKIIRSFTSDYHVLFFVVYLFLSYAYIVFLKKFTLQRSSIVPYLLVFYLYLRGFSSIRSNLAGAFILLALVCLYDKKYFWSYLLLILSGMTHKMGIAFALVVPFCHFFRNKDIRIWHILFLGAISFTASYFVRGQFVGFAQEVDLGGAYGSYVSHTMENGVFSWVNDFGQILMALFFLMYSKKILFDISSISDKNESTKLKLLYLICIFDIIMVPVNQLLGIYRGYEFYYLARLAMWGYFIYRIPLKQAVSLRVVFSSSALLLFIAWFVFRLSRTYLDTCLMPYQLESFF